MAIRLAKIWTLKHRRTRLRMVMKAVAEILALTTPLTGLTRRR